MNYYEHHLGDYDGATAHLSWLEDCAYRRLIGLYYRNEAPIQADLKQACRLVRATSKQERDAVEQVLQEFFELREDGYHQHRCDDDIARFKDKQSKARASADARWSHRKTESERNANASPNAHADDMRTHSERSADGMHRAPVPSPQTPDTSNTPLTPRKRGASVHEFPPGFEAFWSAYPRKTAKGQAAKAFARVRPDDALLATMLAAIQRQSAWPQWTKDRGEFIPHPATWLNGQRWLDQQADAEPQAAAAAPRSDEPEWRREQRERNEAFLGPAAAKRRTTTIDMESPDGTASLLG